MTGELRRLRSGPEAEDDEAPGPFLVRLRFTAEDPAQVIDNARAVLTCVVAQTGDWPTDELWPQLLPSWFIQRCAPEFGNRSVASPLTSRRGCDSGGR